MSDKPSNPKADKSSDKTAGEVRAKLKRPDGTVTEIRTVTDAEAKAAKQSAR